MTSQFISNEWQSEGNARVLRNVINAIDVLRRAFE